MQYSFLVLYDFSQYARQALRVAHQWSGWAGADLHILYNQEATFAPAMADQQVRQQLDAHSRSEAFHRLQRSYEETIGAPIPAKNVHISVKNLAFTITQISSQYNTRLLFAGLKGHGVLKRIFMGSTVLKLLDIVDIPIVAIPHKLRAFEKINLHVGVSYHYIFHSIRLQQFIQLLANKIHSLVFISVLTTEDDRQQAVRHLSRLRATFKEGEDVHTRLFEGNNPFAEVKAYMRNQEDSVLLVQKGSRALSDYLFREFFINELVHDASIPLIILP
ncbi:universal stress protein [Pontibacter toksunensis]|uniref:Universal stress protein n=1 Tax=Pontibacter toksunensis TaxID=1332631 RepID=A0ABW6BW93_9BACT